MRANNIKFILCSLLLRVVCFWTLKGETEISVVRCALRFAEKKMKRKKNTQKKSMYFFAIIFSEFIFKSFS